MFQSLQSASLNLIKQADQFGAVFRPTIKLKTQQYKTVQGGVISIVIYGLSLAYFIYGIQQWATNQILPNIVDLKEVNEVIAYQSSDKIISIYSDNNQIDPFDKSNIILLVLIQEQQNGYPSSDFTRIKQTDGQFYIQNLSLIIDNSDKNNQTSKECFVFIVPCDQQYLEVDEQCASQNIIQSYWDQSNFLLLKFYLQQYNTYSRSLKQLSKQFYISFSQDQTFVNNLFFQQTKAIIDQGILFPDYNQYSFVSDILQQSQSISYQYGSKLFYISSYICLAITMDTLQFQQNIAFANISRVLASIGSIISSLLFFSYIAILINQKSLEDEAIFDVIKMFYPEFNEIIIKKTWFGQIKSIQNNRSNLFYNVKEYKQYYNRLSQVAEQKLCMSNMIYELSRLQFAIQQLISKDELVKLREKHLQVKLQTQKLNQKDIARIKQPSFSQIQPSNDQDSKIIEIHDLKDEELEQGIQSIVNGDCQYNLDNRYQQELFEDDFDILCLNRYLQVRQ